MSHQSELRARLRLPILCAPMFIVSNPEMVIAQSLAGIVGSFPVLNARPQPELAAWLERITTTLDAARKAGAPHVAPFAVNIVIRKTNDRLEDDLETVVRYKVPIVITSLGSPAEVVRRVHDYGGLVFHDVTTVRHAKSALRAGVDGLILVCAGAGGHAGALSPFALLKEVRAFFNGPIVLAGAISDGDAVLAAEVMGADFVYMGTRFIATQESGAIPPYKEMLVEASASDILYTPYFSGIPANYLRPSIARAGLDPDALAPGDSDPSERHKRWKEIWGAGQGVGAIHDLPPIADLVDRIDASYRAARAQWAVRLGAASAPIDAMAED